MFNLVLTVTTVLFYGGFEEHRTVLVHNLSEQECIVNAEKMLDRMIDNPDLSGTVSCDQVPIPRIRP
tara:strand:- start:298 stop:498 length:201 start_codon:yes stop_codon:yes gene_type:complete